MVVGLAVLAGLAATAPGAGAADLGVRGHSFAASGVVDPTGQKPQSKLWFNDGTWWASLFRRSTEEYTIHRLDAASRTWIDTGTVLDDRNSSEADTLWDGRHLYVASGSDATGGIRLTRFSYSPQSRSYAPDSGFPVSVPGGPMEAVVLAKDTSGRLWITLTEGREVLVSHTNGSDRDWATPSTLPVGGASGLAADDIFAVVAYAGRIGVMWSNQNAHAMYFASRGDQDAAGAAWTRTVALEGRLSADDHINLKSVESNVGGKVFAAVKTSLGDDPANGAAADQVLLLAFDGVGWSKHAFGRVEDDHTRPIVVTNQRARRLYVFATSPTWSDAGVQTIYCKESSLDNPSFSPGPGAAFI